MTHARAGGRGRHDSLTVVTGRSGRGTPRQTIRMDEEVWREFGDAAERPGDTNRSELVRAFARWYMRKPGAKLPPRPKLDTDQD